MLTQHYLSFLVIFISFLFLGGGGGVIDLQCCNYCHLWSDFSSKFKSSMTILHHKLLTKKVGFWPINELIHHHDNICSLIHKKCHPKSYHNDIKWHMTLNIIFSVAWRNHSIRAVPIMWFNSTCKNKSTYLKSLDSIKPCYMFLSMQVKNTSNQHPNIKGPQYSPIWKYWQKLITVAL